MHHDFFLKLSKMTPPYPFPDAFIQPCKNTCNLTTHKQVTFNSQARNSQTVRQITGTDPGFSERGFRFAEGGSI